MALSKLAAINSLVDFHATYSNEAEFVIDLMAAGIIRSTRNCSKCGSLMNLRNRKGIPEWRCRSNRSSDCSCKSIKADSWFQNSNLSLSVAFKLFIAIINKWSGSQIEHEFKMSPTTISDWKNMVREVCERIRKSYPPLGGPGCIIEIDETAVHSRKYGRGEIKADTVWIFGGIQRNTRNIFAMVVPDRTARTLVPILKRYVDPQSTVISDSWKAYAKLKEHFRRHEQLCHNTEFSRTADDGLQVTTNSIEAAWKRLKDPIKRANGTSDELLPSYISEFIVREREGDGFFERFLEELAKICSEM